MCKDIDDQTLYQKLFVKSSDTGTEPATYSIYHSIAKKMGMMNLIIMWRCRKRLHDRINMFCICMNAGNRISA